MRVVILLLGGLAYWIFNSADIVAGREQVSVPASEILEQQFLRETGKRPDGLQLSLLQQQAENELSLAAEARFLGLHQQDSVINERLLQLNEFLAPSSGPVFQDADEDLLRSDPVIQRRLVHLMEQRLLQAQDVSPIGRDELETYYRAHSADFRTADRYSFEHRYFSDDSVQVLNSGKVELGVAGPYWAGNPMTGIAELESDRYFGDGFYFYLTTLPLGNWSEPLQSSYGYHLVKINDVSPGKTMTLAKARPRIKAMLEEKRRQQVLSESLALLRQDYGFSG
ncbi:MAG: peptidylprolyl isomerase [Pseudomonadales bacterium]